MRKLWQQTEEAVTRKDEKRVLSQDESPTDRQTDTNPVSARKAVFMDRLNRENIGARATGKALYQMCRAIEIDVIHTFDNDVFDNCEIKGNLDEVEKNIIKASKMNVKMSNLICAIKEADMLIINGEGSLIFCGNNEITRTIRGWAALMKIAKSLGTRTYLLNSEAAPGSDGTVNMEILEFMKLSMEYIDLFVLRSERSFTFAKNYLSKKKSVYVPDALFSWTEYFNMGLAKPLLGDSVIPFPESVFDFGKLDFTKPYICISDSSALDLPSWAQFVPNYVKLIDRLKSLKPEYTIYLVDTGKPGKPFLDAVSQLTNTAVIPVTINLLTMLAILGNAEVFISGRWHPSIMAMLNGTPCVLTDANCHKTMALDEMFCLNIQSKIYSAGMAPEDVDGIVQDCMAIFERQDIRHIIRSKASELSRHSQVLKELINNDMKYHKKIMSQTICPVYSDSAFMPDLNDEIMQEGLLLPRWLGLLISCFIPKKKNRQRFREKYVRGKDETS